MNRNLHDDLDLTLQIIENFPMNNAQLALVLLLLTSAYPVTAIITELLQMEQSDLVVRFTTVLEEFKARKGL